MTQKYLVISLRCLVPLMLLGVVMLAIWWYFASELESPRA